MRMRDIEMSDTAGREEWTYRPPAHRNSHRGQRREIPLGPIGREVLRPYLKPGKLEALVFETGNGDGYDVPITAG